MNASLEPVPAGSIAPVTCDALLGLIVATGLLRTEATGLRLGGATPGALGIRDARLGDQRFVPLSETVQTALDRCFEICSACSSPVNASSFSAVAALRGGPGKPVPRLHDTGPVSPCVLWRAPCAPIGS